jgi:hypothetical protein
MSLSEVFVYESHEESNNSENMNQYEKELDLYLKANNKYLKLELN